MMTYIAIILWAAIVTPPVFVQLATSLKVEVGRVYLGVVVGAVIATMTILIQSGV